MAPRRRAGRNFSGVDRRMLTQRQKLTAQRLPVYQGPSPAPLQGPRLAIPRNLVSEIPTKTRPAPGPDIWNMPKPPAGGSVAAPVGGSGLLTTLGIPAAIGTLLGIGSSMAFPSAAGRGSTLQEQGIDPQAMAEASNRRIAAAKRAAEEADKRPQAQRLSPGARSFDKAFAEARSKGLSEFTWRGNRYNTRYAGE